MADTDTMPEPHTKMDPMQNFYQYVVAQRRYPSVVNLDYFLQWFFHDVPLAGKSVLDVGCGTGMLATYARLAGAARSVGIEPESDGSAFGSLSVFRQTLDDLGIDRVFARSDRIQDFTDKAESFDVVLICNAINHFDERAVARLHRSMAARHRYLRLLVSLHGVVSPGGTLIVTDCGRRNLFRPLTRLGFRHPFEPTIEWHKHQEPQLWRDLLRKAGFKDIRIDWRVPNRLRRFQRILSNGIAARCLTSEFRILAHR